MEASERRLIRFEPCFAFFFFHRAVVLDAEPANERRETQALHYERRQNHDEGKEQNQIAGRKRRAVTNRERQRESGGQRDDTAHARLSLKRTTGH